MKTNIFSIKKDLFILEEGIYNIQKSNISQQMEGIAKYLLYKEHTYNNYTTGCPRKKLTFTNITFCEFSSQKTFVSELNLV